MARREFSDKTKREALLRASRATGFPCCEKCGVMIKRGDVEFDHVIADTFGGKPTLENCECLCRNCHSQKTATIDVPAYAWSERQRTKEAFIRKPSKWLTGRDGKFKAKIGGGVVRRNP